MLRAYLYIVKNVILFIQNIERQSRDEPKKWLYSIYYKYKTHYEIKTRFLSKFCYLKSNNDLLFLL